MPRADDRHATGKLGGGRWTISRQACRPGNGPCPCSRRSASSRRCCGRAAYARDLPGAVRQVRCAGLMSLDLRVFLGQHVQEETPPPAADIAVAGIDPYRADIDLLEHEIMPQLGIAGGV